MPFVPITSLIAIGTPSPGLVVADVEVGVQLRVALADRRAGRPRRARRTRPPSRSSSSIRLARRSAVSVSMLMRAAPGSGRRRGRARCAKTSSRVSDGRGSSSAHAFAISSGCAVGGTSERSSSDTLETASRIAESCSWKRATSSLDQLEPREPRDVQHFVSRDPCHRIDPPIANTKGSSRSPSYDWFRN